MSKLGSFLRSKSFFKQLLRAVVFLIVGVFILLQVLKFYTHHGEKIQVPNIIGLSLDSAQELLDENELRIVVVDSSKYDPQYPQLAVLEQNPTALKNVKSNRKIFVSINPKGYSEITIPDVIQITQRNAISKLNAVGFQLDKVTYIPALGKDMVYHILHKGDTIYAGDKLPRMSKIELVCGDGTRVVNQEENEDE